MIYDILSLSYYGITTYLDIPSVFRYLLTCKSFYSIINGNYVEVLNRLNLKDRVIRYVFLRFGLELSFFDKVYSSGSLIYGSTIVQCLLNVNWFSDLDVLVPYSISNFQLFFNKKFLTCPSYINDISLVSNIDEANDVFYCYLLDKYLYDKGYYIRRTNTDRTETIKKLKDKLIYDQYSWVKSYDQYMEEKEHEEHYPESKQIIFKLEKYISLNHKRIELIIIDDKPKKWIKQIDFNINKIAFNGKEFINLNETTIKSVRTKKLIYETKNKEETTEIERIDKYMKRGFTIINKTKKRKLKLKTKKRKKRKKKVYSK